MITVDRHSPSNSAVAVKDGKILAVGDESLRRRYHATNEIDLKGRTLMPGFEDTHLHPMGASPRDIDAAHAHSIAELQDMLRAKAKQLGPANGSPVFGWQEANFSEKRNPNREDLDAAAPDNPVVLTRAGAHSSVGNSLALKLAKIDRNTADPDTGLIEHGANGEPNGMIRERSDLYRSLVPPDHWEDVRQSYIDGLRALLALGITSFIDASGTIDDEPVGLGGIENPPATLTFHRLQQIYADQGDSLPRVTMYISYPGVERLTAFPHRTGYGDEHVRIGPIGENAVDGGFTGPTAWTLVDYKGLPGFRGKGRFTDAELYEMVDTAAKLGWQMGLHCIGDAAIVQTITIYDKALHDTTGWTQGHGPAVVHRSLHHHAARQHHGDDGERRHHDRSTAEFSL